MIIGSLLESMAEVAELIEDREDINLSGLSTTELIERVKKNTNLVEELIPLLPEDISYYLMSQEFNDACEKRFDECDADGSGDLEPDEMVPIIIEMSKGQGIDVTPAQCIEFAEIFDDDGRLAGVRVRVGGSRV